MNLDRVFRDKRLSQALLGLSQAELLVLEENFAKAYVSYQQSKQRKREIGGGKKGFLPSLRDKLVFILIYIKCYPTFDLQGFLFQLDRTRACRWVHILLPILEQALGYACALPARRIDSPEVFFRAFPGVKDIFVDGMERIRQKPSRPRARNKSYSGKKKQTTRKNIIASDENRRIGYLSPTKSGRRHDKRLLDKDGMMPHVPDEVTTWVDTGFQGLDKQHANTMMPHKATKKKPLTPQQKQENRVISGIRVVVEHAIGGVKRFACTTHVYRNRKAKTDDRFAVIGCGLWNFHLDLAA